MYSVPYINKLHNAEMMLKHAHKINKNELIY